MKPKSILVYLVVLAALGSFYYIYDVRMAAQKNELKKAEAKIYSLEVDQVTEFKSRVGDRELHAVREGKEDWKLVKPFETQADRWEVEGVIRSAVQGEKDRVFEDPIKDFTQFGLDKPEIELTLMDKGKSLAPTLNIGAKNPIGFLSYARLGDSNEVFTITAPFRQDLSKTLYDLRDKSLVLASGEKINRIKVTGANEYELVRKGLRRWDIISPEPGPADGDVVQKILYSALKSKIRQFIDKDQVKPGDKEDPFGFEKSKVKVQIFSEDRPEVKLVIGNQRDMPADAEEAKTAVEGVWARSSERSELLVIIPETAQLLSTKFEAVKDRHVLFFNRGLLTSLNVELKGRGMKVKKIKDIWDVLEPGEPVSQDRHIESFLHSIEDMKFVRVLDDKDVTIEKYGLVKPDMTMEMVGPDEEKHVLTANLEPFEKNLLAVRADKGPVVLINRFDLLDHLPEEIRPENKDAEKEQANVNK